ncbi:MAG: hypothetical protein AAF598_11255, partial [Bacteroidota bacterium]
RRLTQIRNDPSLFVLMVHQNGKGAYQSDFYELGFPKLANLGSGQAYIAFRQNGLISEFTDPVTLSLSLDLPDQQLAAPNQVQNWSKDRNRFIAHAGGMIEGHTYTNSLEALNTSYKKGFRLFELDILQTSDGAFVAAHDWGGWKQSAGFKGQIPPDRGTFNAQLIHGKFQPLDMDQINKWFADHPDAILVTDKIDLPVQFSEAFDYPERLQMELFSWTAVHEALDHGVEPILNEHLLWSIDDDPVAELKDKGIRKIALSRKWVAQQKVLLKQLKAAGIQIYLFHLNQQDRRNETYVLNYELQYAFGMYADDWFFIE